MRKGLLVLGIILLAAGCGGAADPIGQLDSGNPSDAAEDSAMSPDTTDDVGVEADTSPDMKPLPDTGEDTVAPPDTAEDTVTPPDTAEDTVPPQDACQPDCQNKECGSNGCGGSCGNCNDGFECVDGSCECVPDCDDAICGDDGCGGSCGACNEGFDCVNGACVDNCQPECDGKDCGPDGCGGSCGGCLPGETCTAGQCISDCTPDCTGKDCGPNGCGGSCGSCPANQWCDQDTWQCEDGSCDYPDTFDNPVQRVQTLEIGDAGVPGEALDVDHDLGTCAPASDCQDGLDNALSGLLGSLDGFLPEDPDQLLQEYLSSGDLNLLLEPRNFQPGGGTFLMALYYGLQDGYCNLNSPPCDFLVGSESFDDDTCLPMILFDNAIVAGNMISMGGTGYGFELPIPLGLGDPMVVTLQMAQIQGTVTLSGDNIATITGVIGGAIPKQSIVDAINALPADQFPIDKGMIISLLNLMLVPDIDLNGDGQKEGVSVGLPFTSVVGTITGVTEVYSPF